MLPERLFGSKLSSVVWIFLTHRENGKTVLSEICHARFSLSTTPLSLSPWLSHKAPTVHTHIWQLMKLFHWIFSLRHKCLSFSTPSQTQHFGTGLEVSFTNSLWMVLVRYITVKRGRCDVTACSRNLIRAAERFAREFLSGPFLKPKYFLPQNLCGNLRN